MFNHSKVGFAFPDGAETTKSYFICSTPRCGSSLICEALLVSKLAGAPTEYFDANVQANFYKHWDIGSQEEYLAKLLKTKTGPNGVFGSKAHFNQYDRCFGVDQVPSRFPNLRYVWIKRNNTLEQAVSYALAIQTEKWSSSQLGNGAVPVYKFDQIDSLVKRIESEQAKWASFFELHSIEPLLIVYEEFADNLIEGVTKCLNYLDVKMPINYPIDQCTLQKQANQLSLQWVERFHAESQQ